MLRLASLLLAALSAQAATPLFQASFDKPNQGWTVVRGSAAPDPASSHDRKKSLRVEPGGPYPDACVRFAPVDLSIGERYELSGWVRTENLSVRDLDRSPIAIGAALAMASMPFDVHSPSLAGTRRWTRLTLRFVASREQDQILLTVGNGGAFQGHAWFEGVSLEKVSFDDEWPAREAVRTYGPAYRYPAAGWIYLHIQGEPYERGYQHGQLMSREIPEYLERCASDLGYSTQNWQQVRTAASALFLRGFDREILEEMRGIADGASDAGARWLGRRIDLTDIVVANVTVELGELRSAVSVTPTGLEGLSFDTPPYGRKRDSPMDHCSSFAATGPATRDGKMVIGHVTWWSLTLAEQTNVMLDIQPAAGHRLIMQSYPGGIESGTDWYQNDAGVVLTETTIAQTPFNAQGAPVAFRARQAIQYGGDIDGVVERLTAHNNGLYTNEWLIGDAKNDEIAMFELGTLHTKLWRSSKNQWFGDTPGFYWGCNNTKDLAVRLELQPDPHSAPEYIPYVPGVRDLAWQDLYRQYRGQIDEQFAFLAYRSAPLVSNSTMDAKVVTKDMASRLMLWAAIGKPNQRERIAGQGGYAKNDGLYPSGYALFRGEPSATLRAAVAENEKARVPGAAPPRVETGQPPATAGRGGGRGGRGGRGAAGDGSGGAYADRLWKGWVLPASDADTWFVAGSAAYHGVLQGGDPERTMNVWRARYRAMKLTGEGSADRYRMDETKGVLYLDALRRRLGDDRFLQLMNGFFTANATKTVTAQAFLESAGETFDFQEPEDGPTYLAGDIARKLATSAIVYGTAREAGANRYAAEQLQSRFLNQFEIAVPIYKDFEATDDQLRNRDVIFIGRPEANSALAAWAARLGLDYTGSMFRIDGAPHASEREALELAAANPLNPAHMALVIAGNDALRTVKTVQLAGWGQAQYFAYDDGRTTASGFLKTAM